MLTFDILQQKKLRARLNCTNLMYYSCRVGNEYVVISLLTRFLNKFKIQKQIIDKYKYKEHKNKNK